MKKTSLQKFKSVKVGVVIGTFSLLGHLLKLSAIILLIVWPLDFHHEKNCLKVARGTSWRKKITFGKNKCSNRNNLSRASWRSQPNVHLISKCFDLWRRKKQIGHDDLVDCNSRNLDRLPNSRLNRSLFMLQVQRNAKFVGIFHDCHRYFISFISNLQHVLHYKTLSKYCRREKWYGKSFCDFCYNFGGRFTNMSEKLAKKLIRQRLKNKFWIFQKLFFVYFRILIKSDGEIVRK